jgi:hypothetical protein
MRTTSARDWVARILVVLVLLPQASATDMSAWNCSDPVLARPIQCIKCGLSPPAGTTWPLCPGNASIAVGFGLFSLNLAEGTYAGLFTIASAVFEDVRKHSSSFV